MLRVPSHVQLIDLITTEGELVFEGVHLPQELGPRVAAPPSLGKLVRGPRDLPLKAGPDYSFRRTSHRREEVSCGLAIRAMIAETSEVGLGVVLGTEIDLPPLVQDGDLVEDLAHEREC